MTAAEHTGAAARVPAEHTGAAARVPAEQSGTAAGTRSERDDAPQPGRIRARYVAVGATCGLAWAAGFRAYMMQLAGDASHFEWFGTFGAILAPGVIVGALLGFAAARLAAGRRRGILWFALSPLLFAIVPMLAPGALITFLTQGLGGGAIGVALIAVAGGFSLGRVGPVWARAVCGVIAWAGAAGVAATVPLIGGPHVALGEPRGAWAVVLAFSFVAVLMIATSIPFLRPRAVPRQT